MAVGAAGVNVPLIISYPRSPPSVAYAMDGLRNRMRGDTDKGYMTTELFMIWPQGVIEHASKNLCPINGPAKNALWGHVIDICRAKETEILLLPQTDHMLQLLGINISKPLKAVFSCVGLVSGDRVVEKNHFFMSQEGCRSQKHDAQIH